MAVSLGRLQQSWLEHEIQVQDSSSVLSWCSLPCPNTVAVVVHLGLSLQGPGIRGSVGSILYFDVPLTCLYTYSRGRRGREPARIDHFWSVFLSHQSAQPLPTPTQNGPHAWKRWEGVTLGCLCLQGELLGKSCHLWASLSSSMKWETHEPQPSTWHVAGTCLSILLASSSPIRSCSGQGNLGAWGAVGWMGHCQPWPFSTAMCALSCSKHFTKHLLVSAHTSLGDCMVPVALKQRIYPLR